MTVSIASGDFIDPDNFTAALDDLDTRVTNLETNNPRCAVSRSSSQTITELTGTAIAFDTENWDVGPMHSGSSDQLIAPLAGIYHVEFYAVWATDTRGYRKINIRANGGDVSGQGPMDGDGTEPTQQSCSVDVFLDVGGYLQGFVYYDSSGALATLDIVGARMSAFYIGTAT